MEFSIHRDPASAFSDLLWQLMDMERGIASLSPLRVVSATAFVLWMKQDLKLNASISASQADFWAALETSVNEEDWRQAMARCSRTMLDRVTREEESANSLELERVLSILLEETMALSIESRRRLCQFASQCDEWGGLPPYSLDSKYVEAGDWVARGIDEMVSLSARKFPHSMEMVTPQPVTNFMAQLVAAGRKGRRDLRSLLRNRRFIIALRADKRRICRARH